MPAPLIREATAADAAALTPLMDQLGYPTTPPRLLPALAEVQQAGARVLVAELDGSVEGVAVVFRMITLHKPAPVAYLSALVVGEGVRGRGVGKALIAAVESLGRGWGCAAIELTSNNRRADAHQFYAALGFTSESRKFRRVIPAAESA
ncbi:MAG: GNAT family N-acetyltransferase [Gemmatimonadales bacterium]